MTKIEWVVNPDGSKGETWNPLVGCKKISPGCANCYAERMTKRLKAMGISSYQDVIEENHWSGEVKLIEDLLEVPSNSLAFKDHLVGENLFFLLSELVVTEKNIKEFLDVSEDYYVAINESPYFFNQVKLLDGFNAYAFITALELTDLSKSFSSFYGVSVFNSHISNAKVYPLKSIDKSLKTSMLTDTCLATLIQHEVERTLYYNKVSYFVCGNKDDVLMKDFADKANWDYLSLDAENDFSRFLELGDQE